MSDRPQRGGRGGGRGGGGRGGGGGGFRGGRGGGAPRERSAGRDATSLDKLFNKNTRYDHRVAKEQQFWEKSKKLRSYNRLLKKEGLAPTPRGGPNAQSSTATGANAIELPPSSSTTSSSTHIPSHHIQVANPDAIFATGEPDAFTRQPQGRPKKNRKRPREDGAAEGGGEDAMDTSSSAAAAASSSSSSGRAPLPADTPDFKKQRRLTPAELAAAKEEKRKAWEQKQKDLVVQREKREQRHELLTQKTKKGQPILANQMQVLLEKLQKQAATKK